MKYSKNSSCLRSSLIIREGSGADIKLLDCFRRLPSSVYHSITTICSDGSPNCRIMITISAWIWCGILAFKIFRIKHVLVLDWYKFHESLVPRQSRSDFHAFLFFKCTYPCIFFLKCQIRCFESIQRLNVPNRTIIANPPISFDCDTL